MSALLTSFDVFSIRFPQIEKYAAFDDRPAQEPEGKLPDELMCPIC